jgi:hypothetical protein
LSSQLLETTDSPLGLCQVCTQLFFKSHKEQVDAKIPEKDILVAVPREAVVVRMVQWNGFPVNQNVCLPHYEYQEGQGLFRP